MVLVPGSRARGSWLLTSPALALEAIEGVNQHFEDLHGKGAALGSARLQEAPGRPPTQVLGSVPAVTILQECGMPLPALGLALGSLTCLPYE